MPFDNTQQATQVETYVRNLTHLRDFIADLPAANFDYHTWINTDYLYWRQDGTPEVCGTVGCVGGWLEMLAINRRLPFENVRGSMTCAESLLKKFYGISEEEFRALCCSTPNYASIYSPFKKGSLAHKINQARLENHGLGRMEAVAALNAAITYYQENTNAV